jgi:hypothetical protein
MKSPTLSLLVFSAAILLFSAAAANGQTKSDQRSASSAEAAFKSLDRNRDKALSKAEAQADASISAAFVSADANLDGYISQPEYLAYVTWRATPQRSAGPPPIDH